MINSIKNTYITSNYITIRKGRPVCTTSQPKTNTTYNAHKLAQYCVSLKLDSLVQSKKTQKI